MENDNWIGILIILFIVFISLYGGSMKSNGGFFYVTPNTTAEKQYNIQQKLDQTQSQLSQVEKKIEAEKNKKFESIYKGKVIIDYISRSSDPKYEFVEIRNVGTEKISLGGWTVKSNASGQGVSIPKATYLYFSGSPNNLEVYLEKNFN